MPEAREKEYEELLISWHKVSVKLEELTLEITHTTLYLSSTIKYVTLKNSLSVDIMLSVLIIRK